MIPIKIKIAPFVFFILIFTIFPHHVTADSVSTPGFSSSNAFTGDLPEIQKRRFIRVLVTYSKTNFFLMKGIPHGFEYELLKQYEKFLNKGKGKRTLKTQLVFIPVPFDQHIPALLKGRGDIVAAGLTNTPDRRKRVAFTTPYLPRVDEIVVSHKGTTGLNDLTDLSGRTVSVVRASSYMDSLKSLNAQFFAKKRQPANIVEVSENLEAEDVLELVNAGVLKVTVVDQHIAELWSGVLTNLVLHTNLKANQGGQIAWAVRPNNPELRISLNRFIKGNKNGTLIGNILFKRYYQNRNWIKNPLEEQERKKLDRFIQLFKEYGNRYEFDWLAIAAQAYQESEFDHSARSSRGAVGIMQMLPSTAASRAVNIPNIEKLENNIHAGVKYVAWIRDRYFSGPEISPADQANFSFAAYNAGPSKIQKMRRKAKTMRLNPDKWFYNVELAALKHIGQEPVRYVANIHKYYIAYSMISESLNKKAQEMKATKN
jgi:membrane-bound lytic murein transglycosylase MltF